MSNVIFLIDQLAVGLYAVLAGLILLQGWRLVSARGEYRATYYELERDLARQRQAGALTTVIVLFEIGLLVVGVQVSAAPYLQTTITLEDELSQVQQPIEEPLFVTDTPPPVVDSGLDLEPADLPFDGNEVGFVSTPTLTPTPVGTLVPNPPPIEGCSDERAILQIPANGMRVFQPTTIRGTAFTDQFSVAKIEIRGSSTFNEYAVVDTIDQIARSTVELSQFVPSDYEEGLYQFRLTVFDITNTLVASCMVNIYLSAPPVAPTPTATQSSP